MIKILEGVHNVKYSSEHLNVSTHVTHQADRAIICYIN
jgi:hypothetical protein